MVPDLRTLLSPPRFIRSLAVGWRVILLTDAGMVESSGMDAAAIESSYPADFTPVIPDLDRLSGVWARGRDRKCTGNRIGEAISKAASGSDNWLDSSSLALRITEPKRIWSSAAPAPATPPPGADTWTASTLMSLGAF
jgi:hypothetical protein